MAVHPKNEKIPRIPQLGGENWILEGMTDFTILFGKNGSGKSVLLRAWRDKYPDNVHYVAPERTGEMDFNANFVQQESNSQERRNASSGNFILDYRKRIVGRIQSFFLARGNFRGEGTPPGNPEELEKFIGSLVTDFSLQLIGGFPPYEIFRNESTEKINGVSQLSSGEIQLITIGLDILTIGGMWEIQNQQNRIILIDEPDAHIHPDLQIRFSDFLFKVSKRFNIQVVIATHSTSLLAAMGQFGGEKTSVIYLTRNNDKYKAQPFTAVHKELAACLGGHILMGPLFGALILLVEGDDDFRIWGQVPRHHVINLAVIPSNGDEIKRYQKILEKIFTSLRDPNDFPCGYALRDGDKEIPEPSQTNPQKFIKYIKLNCHEAENLYLSDQVLEDLGLTWEQAMDKILQSSSQFGDKKTALNSVQSWDRKQQDLKNLIYELEQILEPKGVPWTVRVGKKIGSTRPEGQLHDFLGEEVVSALWGPLEGDEEDISCH